MTFGEKLKSIRKQVGMSQEKLAERLGVSRQAVTKWETELGFPDIENLIAISEVFRVSIDELLSHKEKVELKRDYLYESVTEYDIDDPKRYDMKLGGANTLILSGYDGEKIRVRLASNTVHDIQSDFKLKIDDIRNRIDVEIIRRNGMTEATAKQAVAIFVQIPRQYVRAIEIAANVETVEIHSLECDSIELDTKTKSVVLDGVIGTVEINCNLDMHILCRTLQGAVEINQISATSRLCLPERTPFSAVCRGIRTSILYEKSGKRTEDFSTPDSDNIIELNGIKSELVIYTS